MGKNHIAAIANAKATVAHNETVPMEFGKPKNVTNQSFWVECYNWRWIITNKRALVVCVLYILDRCMEMCGCGMNFDSDLTRDAKYTALIV